MNMRQIVDAYGLWAVASALARFRRHYDYERGDKARTNGEMQYDVIATIHDTINGRRGKDDMRAAGFIKMAETRARLRQ